MTLKEAGLQLGHGKKSFVKKEIINKLVDPSTMSQSSFSEWGNHGGRWFRVGKSIRECQFCSTTQTLTAHHLIPKSERENYKGDSRLQQTVQICRQCHDVVHFLAPNSLLATDYSHPQNLFKFYSQGYQGERCQAFVQEQSRQRKFVNSFTGNAVSQRFAPVLQISHFKLSDFLRDNRSKVHFEMQRTELLVPYVRQLQSSFFLQSFYPMSFSQVQLYSRSPRLSDLPEVGPYEKRDLKLLQVPTLLQLVLSSLDLEKFFQEDDSRLQLLLLLWPMDQDYTFVVLVAIIRGDSTSVQLNQVVTMIHVRLSSQVMDCTLEQFRDIVQDVLALEYGYDRSLISKNGMRYVQTCHEGSDRVLSQMASRHIFGRTQAILDLRRYQEERLIEYGWMSEAIKRVMFPTNRPLFWLLLKYVRRGCYTVMF